MWSEPRSLHREFWNSHLRWALAATGRCVPRSFERDFRELTTVKALAGLDPGGSSFFAGIRCPMVMLSVPFCGLALSAGWSYSSCW